MSAPSYIINWEELLGILGDKFEIDINDIDLGDLEEYLFEKFGEVVDLLKQILELLKDKGVQRVHSVANHVPAIVADSKFPTRFAEDVLITGITYSQSGWKYQDSWSLKVGEDVLFDEVGTKEIGESKAMNVFYFLPAGTYIDIVFHNKSGNSRLVWFDIEYIGLNKDSFSLLSPPTGTIVVHYMTKDGLLLDSDIIGSLEHGDHLIKPDSIPSGYLLLEPDRHYVSLSDMNSTEIVGFIVKKEELPPINHDYDWLIVARWEDDTNTDLDLHCYFDRDTSKHVYYGNKSLVEDESNKAWLDYDYTSHGANGRESQAEIISILGMEEYKSGIYITNFNGGELLEDITIEIFRWVDEKYKKIDSISINAGKLSGAKVVHVCNIKNRQLEKIVENVPYNSSNII